MSFLIFTDLDGTLLDHYSYRWDEAAPALNRIQTLKLPLILNSSKTAAELLRLRHELDNQHPFITENGGAVAVPAGYFGSEAKITRDGMHWTRMGPEYSEIVDVLRRIRGQANFRFRGFSDMAAMEVSQLTGLTLIEADLAKQREATEPLVWQDTNQSLQRFIVCLREYGLSLTRGGRYYHVTGSSDKGQAVKWLVSQYRAVWPGRGYISVGLGDGPNDIPMLEAVDIAVVMKPVQGDPIHPQGAKRVIFSEVSGAKGWRQAVEQILGEVLHG